MPSNQPKISIVVPVFDAESYLDDCLDSLQRQTLEDIEIICIDDGSTDSSAARLEQRAAMDDRVVVIHQANSGPAAARNTGLTAARGQFIGFVDADDWVANDYFELLYRRAEQGGADLVRTEYVEVFGTTTKPSYANQYLAHRFLADAPLTVIDHIHVIWNAIYRVDYLRANGIDYFDTNCDGVEDVPFSARAAHYSRLSLPMLGAIYYYRKRVDNQLTTVSLKRLNHTLIAARITAEFLNAVQHKNLHDYLSAFKKNLINLNYWHKSTLPLIGADRQEHYLHQAAAIAGLCQHPDLLRKYYREPFLEHYLNADLRGYLALHGS